MKLNLLKNNRIIFFFVNLFAFLSGGYFLIQSQIKRVFDFSGSQFFSLFLFCIIWFLLIILSYFSYKFFDKNKSFWLLISQKNIYFFLFSVILFFVSNLIINQKIPLILGKFIILTLIAVFLTLIFSFLKNKIAWLDIKIKKQSPFILGAMIIIFIIFYTWICFLRFEAGLSNLYDLGNMEQAIWGTLHGYFLRSTTGALLTRLERHVDIFLILIVPFYTLWQSPKLLLLIQIIIAGLGALPLYLITKKNLKSSLAGLIFAFAYLSSPILGAALLFDFHSVTLVSSFLFFAFYFLLEKRYLLYFIFIFLALNCKEEISLLIFLLGIYIYFKHNKKVGIVTSLLGVLWFFISFFAIIPYFSGQVNNKFLIERYNYLGESQKDIFKNFIKQPGVIIKNLWNIDKLIYIFYLILSLGGLMIFSSFTLLGISSFLIYILSNFWPMYSGGYHYSSVLLFYLITGSIFGLKFCLKKIKKKKNIIYTFLLFVFFSVLFYGVCFRLEIWGPQRQRFDIQGALKERKDKKEEIKMIKNLVPKKEKISTSGAVGVFFAGRKDIYLFPKIEDAVYVILDRPIPLDASNSYADYLRDLDNQLKRNKKFKIIFQGNYYLVAKNNSN